MAAVISAPALEFSPIVAASAVHNFIKSRRETSASAEKTPSVLFIVSLQRHTFIVGIGQ